VLDAIVGIFVAWPPHVFRERHEDFREGKPPRIVPNRNWDFGHKVRAYQMTKNFKLNRKETNKLAYEKVVTQIE
jgi:hypothetical protein